MLISVEKSVDDVFK